MIRNQGYH